MDGILLEQFPYDIDVSHVRCKRWTASLEAMTGSNTSSSAYAVISDDRKHCYGSPLFDNRMCMSCSMNGN